MANVFYLRFDDNDTMKYTYSHNHHRRNGLAENTSLGYIVMTSHERNCFSNLRQLNFCFNIFLGLKLLIKVKLRVTGLCMRGYPPVHKVSVMRNA